MGVLRISTLTDPRLADYQNVPDADLLQARGLFIAEGRLVVRRLLEGQRYAARSVMVTDAAFGALGDLLTTAPLPVYVVPQPVMNGITGFNLHRGCLAIGERGTPLDADPVLASASRVVALERVANADNVGGIFRSAAALGADGVLLDPVTTDPLYRKAIRTSMGTALHVPFARLSPWPQALQQILDAGMTLVGLTTASDAPPLRQVAARLRHARTVVLLGHEGDGLTPDALAFCQHRARIPTAPGVDSLNVATAAAIALYQLAGGDLEA